MNLAIRPVFHWENRRIRAHIAICCMAFCCAQHLRRRLALGGMPMSPDAIRRELAALQISILAERGTSRRFALPSSISTAARRIYGSLGLKWNTAPFPIRTGRRKPAGTR